MDKQKKKAVLKKAVLTIMYSDNHEVTLTIEQTFADRIIEKLNSRFCKSIIVGYPKDKRFLILKEKIRNISIEPVDALYTKGEKDEN